ncbi:MAG TPA: hypothetical protein VIM18_10765 [Solirubrobacteraceae bacterium]|jgi:hypothetical protein
MTAARPPMAEHVQFDALCEGLEEYDALPSVRPEPPEPVQEHDEEGRSERLDDQILGGLVSP